MMYLYFIESTGDRTQFLILVGKNHQDPISINSINGGLLRTEDLMHMKLSKKISKGNFSRDPVLKTRPLRRNTWVNFRLGSVLGFYCCDKKQIWGGKGLFHLTVLLREVKAGIQDRNLEVRIKEEPACSPCLWSAAFLIPPGPLVQGCTTHGGWALILLIMKMPQTCLEASLIETS